MESSQNPLHLNDVSYRLILYHVSIPVMHGGVFSTLGEGGERRKFEGD
jgi:hypothetical protein